MIIDGVNRIDLFLNLICILFFTEVLTHRHLDAMVAKSQLKISDGCREIIEEPSMKFYCSVKRDC